MKIEVNIQKKKFSLLLIIALLIASIVTVYAFGTDRPSVFGHSSDEIAYKFSVVQKRIANGCSDNQAISSVAQDGGVKCVTVGDTEGEPTPTPSGCTSIADLDGATTQQFINVPSECIGKLCTLMLSTKDDTDTSQLASYVSIVHFIQDVPQFGSARENQWFTDDGKQGKNDGSETEEIIMKAGPATDTNGRARVVDDHRFISSNPGQIAVFDSNGYSSHLYLCQ